jgi:hypothetical protein
LLNVCVDVLSIVPNKPNVGRRRPMGLDCSIHSKLAICSSGLPETEGFAYWQRHLGCDGEVGQSLIARQLI